MPLLGVNIDHVATVRQARKGHEPDPAAAAHAALLAGAHIITVHLREDRRHIQDADLHTLAATLKGGARLNLEMAATPEMLTLAAQLARRHGAPHMVTLVPEKRRELTTEGGLNVAASAAHLARAVKRLKAAAPITISAFIATDPAQIAAAADAGFDACEFHTGPYAHAFEAAGGDFELRNLRHHLDTLATAGHAAATMGMRFHAGHALNYHNVQPVAALPGLQELHIGHSIVSRALFTGLHTAVADMLALINTARS